MYMPGPVGQSLRRRYWRKRLRSMGENVRIDQGVEILNPGYVSLGSNIWLDRDVTILAGEGREDREIQRVANEAYTGIPGGVHIGSYTHVGPRCVVSGIGAGVWIGDYCGLGTGTCVYAWSNHFASKATPWDRHFIYSASAPLDMQCIIAGPIVFEDNVGSAINSVILPGVHLRRDSFVMIGGVVLTGEYEENSVLGGQPARRLFKRFRDKKNK
jgi:acetyltransferase-like isoleucine patch superfamily enzyme